MILAEHQQRNERRPARWILEISSLLISPKASFGFRWTPVKGQHEWGAKGGPEVGGEWAEIGRKIGGEFGSSLAQVVPSL